MPPRPIVMSAEVAKLMNRHARWSIRKREIYRWLLNQLNLDIHGLEIAGQLEGPCVFQSTVDEARIVAWTWTTDDKIAVCVTSVRFGDGDGWRPNGGPRNPRHEHLDVISGSTLRGGGRYWELDQDYGDDIGAPGPVNRDRVDEKPGAETVAPEGVGRASVGVSGKPSGRFFISYRRSDRRAVEIMRARIARDLERSGFVDRASERNFQLKFVSGSNWEARLLQLLKNADVFIFIATTSTLSSWCLAEMRAQKGIPVIPVRLDAIDAHFKTMERAIVTHGGSEAVASMFAQQSQFTEGLVQNKSWLVKGKALLRRSRYLQSINAIWKTDLFSTLSTRPFSRRGAGDTPRALGVIAERLDDIRRLSEQVYDWSRPEHRTLMTLLAMARNRCAALLSNMNAISLEPVAPPIVTPWSFTTTITAAAIAHATRSPPDGNAQPPTPPRQ